MVIDKKEFKKEFGRAVVEGYASIFAGAGLSKSAGFVNWKELVTPFAKSLNLNIDDEHDLIGLTQYYKNEKGNKAKINQIILNNFISNEPVNENIKIVTRLPISTYWTTNYDELLEEGLKLNNRKADIKISQASLANNIFDRDAVIYKMHGDVRQFENAVLTKDDYETYNTNRSLFTTALQGDLVSKTFLFIGFSFEDPNLDYILGRIRVLLGEDVREHYCFLEKINKKNYKKEDEQKFIGDKVRQELKIRDLQRYGIQVVLLDSYNEITPLLLEIEKDYLNRNIFISGSISEYNDKWTEELANNFSYTLSKKLVEHNLTVISGFGLGVGSSVINGALEAINKIKYKHLNEHLILRPFPQNENEGLSLQVQWERYRKNIINEAGICIFIFGNKIEDGKVVPASGMINEFKIAIEKNKFIIPVGATGEASLDIFKTVQENIDNYLYLKDYLEDLGDQNKTTEDLVKIIITIIESLQVF